MDDDDVERSFLSRMWNLVRNKSSADVESNSKVKGPSPTIDPDGQPYPPNVSLNFVDTDRAIKRGHLRVVALFGIILQSGVLVAEGVIKYYLRMVKDDSPISNAAFQICVIGTVLLILGMLGCSYIVEKSTVETRWTTTPKGKEFYIMWVQRAQDVNDQQFESFALFARGKRTSILTSNPAQHLTGGRLGHARPQKTREGGGGGASKGSAPGKANGFSQRAGSQTRSPSGTLRNLDPWKPTKSFRETDHSTPTDATETLAVVASIACVCGFVLQFMGLRGMHWSATVAQVGSTLLMSALRAWVRRDLAEIPFSQALPHGFELDWLATRLLKFQLPGSEGHSADGLSLWQLIEIELAGWQGKPAQFNLGDLWRKEYVHQGETAPFSSLLISDHRETAAEAVLVRKRLSELTGWRSQAEDVAKPLEKAMERVINILTDVGTEDINLPSLQRTNCMRPAYQFKLRAGREWQVNSAEMEAVISLWLYALDGKPEGEKKVQLLGPSSQSIVRDYYWWLESSSPVIKLYSGSFSEQQHVGPEDPVRDLNEVVTARDLFGNWDDGIGRFPSRGLVQN
jgi:hypothetical protein